MRGVIFAVASETYPISTLPNELRTSETSLCWYIERFGDWIVGNGKPFIPFILLAIVLGLILVIGMSRVPS